MQEWVSTSSLSLETPKQLRFLNYFVISNLFYFKKPHAVRMPFQKWVLSDTRQHKSGNFITCRLTVVTKVIRPTFPQQMFLSKAIVASRRMESDSSGFVVYAINRIQTHHV